MRNKNTANRNNKGWIGQQKTEIIKFRVSAEWKETIKNILAKDGFMYHMEEATKDISKFFRRMISEGMLRNVTPEHIPAIQNLLEEK